MKVIPVKTCYDCPYLRLTPFSRGGFDCRQREISKLIVTTIHADQWKDDNFPIPDWCPLAESPETTVTPETTQIAAKCCAIILSVDSLRGNEKQAATFIAEEYGIDLHKLEQGGYNV